MQFDDLKHEALVRILTKLVDKLDELDGEDYFGTEGWRRYLGMEQDVGI